MHKGKKDIKPDVKESFKEFFSDQTSIARWVSIYDRQDFCGDNYRTRMNQALSWLDVLSLSKNSKILDVGCGAGILTCGVGRRGYKVFGMDYSYGMIEKANSICNPERKQNVKFLQGDIESLPFKDSSFDMILCLGVISYLKSEEKALRELSKVLKPRGTLILSSLNKAHLVQYLDPQLLVKNILKKILGSRVASWRKKAEIKKGSALRHYFTPNLRKSLEMQGFMVLEHKTIPFKLLKFFGREIFPKKINIKITMFLEKFPNIPFIGPLGGMCIFRVRKSPFGVPSESELSK